MGKGKEKMEKRKGEDREKMGWKRRPPSDLSPGLRP